jgi:magnesium transporter
MEHVVVAPVEALELDTLALRLAHEHVADIVERLNERPLEEQARLVAQLPDEKAIEVLDQPDLDDPAGLVAALPIERAIALLPGMSADRLAEVFRTIADPPRSELLAGLDAETAAALRRVLSFPENTAGSLMTTEFVSVPSTWTVAQTLDHIRRVESTRETVYAIYVLDPRTRRLIQAVSLRRLITADPAAPVLSAARFETPITVSPLVDREDVARMISKYDLLAVPVVDEHARVIGIVTVDDVIDAIVAEGTEDAQKFGGMEAIDEPYDQISFREMIRKRGGWLCVLLIGEMLTASAMQYFEGELEKAIVLTLFIPLIMSAGGNSGSQATSLLIRALALGEVKLGDWWKVALREAPTGLTLGLLLGVVGAGRVVAWQLAGFYDYGEHWHLIAATIGAALTAIVAFGSLTGSMLPFILKRAGFDPASASAPLVATLVDVTGLVIYFSVAMVILRGTLL